MDMEYKRFQDLYNMHMKDRIKFAKSFGKH